LKTFSKTPVNEKKRDIVCNICGSVKYKKYLECHGYFYVQCLNCKLVYQNPQPIVSDLEKRYDGEYFNYELRNDENFFNLMKLGLRDIGFDNSNDIKYKGKHFLDIGCATGMLLQYMKKKDCLVQGVEICRESAEYGIKHRHVPIFIGTLEQAAFPANYFHFIHFSHLIEHVPDPRRLLCEVKRILKPSGYAIITTPNIDGLQARLFKSRWRSAIADHIFLFSKKTLTSLVCLVGFTLWRIVCAKMAQAAC
jgi:2-polyprenyl-3-methyl-5-hydroxy-6-metoxy-1,4-benzoquinol methylase